MDNFTYSIPTTVHFGKGQIAQLRNALEAFGKTALMVYGGGSVKKNGLYDEVTRQCREAGIRLVECGGVEPNPRIGSVRRGVELCRAEGVDVVLAVGGGSVIDAAKVIAASVSYDGDPWEIVLDTGKIKDVLPIVTVLTISATGSEMDTFAVISDMELKEKLGCGHPAMRPRVSICDPEYTTSVSAYQTAAGTADIMSHLFEAYFTPENGAFTQNRMAEGLLKTCLRYGVQAVEEPENYEARANLMWASSWAINGFLEVGKGVPWSVHPMEHELSAYYDITHGAGLAILTPHWMRAVLGPDTADKFVEFAKNVWGIECGDSSLEAKLAAGEKAIQATAAYFRAMKLPATLREVGIDEKYFDIMSQKATARLKGAYVELDAQAVRKIFEAAL